MPKELRFTLRDFDNGIDWSQAVRVPGASASSSAAGQAAARAAISAMGRTRAAAAVGSIQELADSPSAKVTIRGTIPGVTVPGIVTEFTVTLGPGGNVGAYIQGSASGGLYWWIRPGPDEIGIWGSVGVGVTTNMGFSVGGQLAVWYGGTSVMTGESLGVAIDVSIGAVTVTGMMFFSVPPTGMLLTPGMKFPATSPPGWTARLIGLGFGLAGGWSVLPMDISVGPSMTWAKAI